MSFLLPLCAFALARESHGKSMNLYPHPWAAASKRTRSRQGLTFTEHHKVTKDGSTLSLVNVKSTNDALQCYPNPSSNNWIDRELLIENGKKLFPSLIIINKWDLFQNCIKNSSFLLQEEGNSGGDSLSRF